MAALCPWEAHGGSGSPDQDSPPALGSGRASGSVWSRTRAALGKQGHLCTVHSWPAVFFFVTVYNKHLSFL